MRVGGAASQQAPFCDCPCVNTDQRVRGVMSGPVERGSAAPFRGPARTPGRYVEFDASLLRSQPHPQPSSSARWNSRPGARRCVPRPSLWNRTRRDLFGTSGRHRRRLRSDAASAKGLGSACRRTRSSCVGHHHRCLGHGGFPLGHGRIAGHLISALWPTTTPEASSCRPASASGLITPAPAATLSTAPAHLSSAAGSRTTPASAGPSTPALSTPKS